MRQRKTVAIENLHLTNDPLENIKIMAPYLNKEQQKAVYFVMFGMVSGNDGAESKGSKETIEAR